MGTQYTTALAVTGTALDGMETHRATIAGAALDGMATHRATMVSASSFDTRVAAGLAHDIF